MLEKNQLFTAQIEEITSEGSGVCRIDGFTVFVPDTAIGDVVSVKIVKVLKSYAYGIIDKLITPSEDRIENDCPYYKKCGGCVFRHISYEAECRTKDSIVRNAFKRIGGIEPEFESFISAEETSCYRNKAQYPLRSGKNGIESLMKHLPPVKCAIIGEPTGMQPAVAEKGLMVLDCVAKGVSGHAARNEGVNAIYNAMSDIEWFRNYKYPKSSELFGDVKMTVTQVNAGTQHNVIPDSCSYVVDIRSNECYSNSELLDIIKSNVKSEVKARSTRLNSSSIALDHPLVKRAIELGRRPYGSPTLSNQALLNIPTLKMGPGDTARSHTANEYVLISEIREGMELFCKMLDGLRL